MDFIVERHPINQWSDRVEVKLGPFIKEDMKWWVGIAGASAICLVGFKVVFKMIDNKNLDD